MSRGIRDKYEHTLFDYMLRYLLLINLVQGEIGILLATRRSACHKVEEMLERMAGDWGR